MTITALPTPAPSRSQSPDVFEAAVDAHIAALPTFVSEANALAIAMNLNSTTDTSVSSVLIGTGAKTFTVSSGKSFQPGMWLVIADSAAPTTNAMFSQVTSYSGTTLIVNSYAIMGSGTMASWVISQSAPAALEGLYALVAGSASQTFSVAAGTSAEHAARIDQVSLLPTVASATTPDIFGAAGVTINYTGTTTATGITACTTAQVGSKKTIIPVTGASFTASANMVVDGATSGTYLMPANAVVEIIATSTTTFKITTIFASGTWTPVYALGTPGTSSFGTYAVQYGSYTKIGNKVTVACKITAGTFSLGTGSGNLYVNGVPWAVNSSGAPGSACINYAASFTTLAPTHGRIDSAFPSSITFSNASGATFTILTSANCATSMRTDFIAEYFV